MLSVIIGRFQTPYLHNGHLELIRQAKNHSENLLVLIGVTAATGTDKNPLSYKAREDMVSERILAVTRPLHDMPSDKDWSDQIDSIIESLGFSEAKIFGGRDNSIEGYYFGKHPIEIISHVGNYSSTAIRKDIAKNYALNDSARAGVIHHIENRYPIVYSTVDVAIYRLDDYGNLDSILMGKKGDKFCFVGGFVDPQDEDLEAAAKREAREETGFDICINTNFSFSDLEYQFSSKVEDRRYIGTKDSIMTHFFSCHMVRPKLPAMNKIQDKEFKEFAWIPAAEKSLDLISDAHKPLFLKFINSKN